VIEELVLSLHGISLKLDSDNAAFISYAKEYLADLAGQESDEVDVSVRLVWGNMDISRDGLQKIGRRLWLGDTRVVQTEILAAPGLQIGMSSAERGLTLDAIYRPVSGLLSRVRAQVFGPSVSDQERRFVTAIYYLVYFPLLWCLEQERGWYVLHASAVAHPAGGIILVGLPGVGKSTLSLSFLADPTVRLLSDNLLLHDGEKVYAFPEPIHLDQRSRNLMPSLGGRFVATDRQFSHGRFDHRLTPSARAWEATPRLLCFLRFAEDVNLRPMAAAECMERVLSFDLLAKEVEEYAKYAAVFSLSRPKEGRTRARLEALERLVNQVSCYELGVQPDTNLSKVVSQVIGRLLELGE